MMSAEVPVTRRFTVSLPDALMRKFDRYLARRTYRNRSEAVRDLIREALVGEEWRADAETVGTVTLVYDHHVHDLGEKLNHIQHEAGAAIVSVLHVHLDHHNCLEVLVVRGSAERIRAIADSLITTRGVKFGKLTAATTGRGLA